MRNSNVEPEFRIQILNKHLKFMFWTWILNLNLDINFESKLGIQILNPNYGYKFWIQILHLNFKL